MLVVLAVVVPPGVYEPGTCRSLGESRVGGNGWRSEQEPDNAGVRQDRIRATCAHPGSGDDPQRPAGAGVLEVRLEPGDVNAVAGGGHRAEVYDRYPALGSTPADRWPDPPGSTRRYTVPVFVPEAPPADPSGELWGPIFTQLKGRHGGSPVRSLTLRRGRFYSDSSIAGRFDLGPVRPGRWATFEITETLSPDAAVGGVEIRRDGEVVVPWRHVATMETYWAEECRCRRTDPVYLKVGLYADSRWRASFRLAFGPVRVERAAPPRA